MGKGRGSDGRFRPLHNWCRLGRRSRPRARRRHMERASPSPRSIRSAAPASSGAAYPRSSSSTARILPKTSTTPPCSAGMCPRRDFYLACPARQRAFRGFAYWRAPTQTRSRTIASLFSTSERSSTGPQFDQAGGRQGSHRREGPDCNGRSAGDAVRSRASRHAISSNEVFHLEELPKRIVIAGGGWMSKQNAWILFQLRGGAGAWPKRAVEMLHGTTTSKSSTGSSRFPCARGSTSSFTHCANPRHPDRNRDVEAAPRQAHPEASSSPTDVLEDVT